jgi:hypothetical protein
MIHILALQRSKSKDNTPVKSNADIVDDEPLNVNSKRGSAAPGPVLVREHFADLRSEIQNVMEAELRPLLRKIIEQEFLSIRNEIRSFDESLKFFNSQFEDIKKNIAGILEDNKLLRNDFNIM